MQGFKSSSNMNLSNILNVNDHISINSIPIKAKINCSYILSINSIPIKAKINCSLMEPAIFEKLHYIKLLHSVFRVTTFFQFDSNKVALSILLQYMHNFNENLKMLFSKLVINNLFKSRSHNERQCILSFSALHNSNFEEHADSKVQIMQLTSQVDNIFSTLDQPNPKCTQKGIIHSLFNFLFGNSNSAKEIKAIKTTWQ